MQPDPVQAGRPDRPEVAETLAAAFAADPMIDWLLRDDARRPQALRSFFRLIVDFAVAQRARIERPASGGAAAIWVAYETAPKPSWWLETRATFVFLNACGRARVERGDKARKALEANHPKGRPHDYLSFLGVRPHLQGNGLGGQLLATHTARLDAAGRPAFLETANPRTIPLYASHGFEVTGEYRAAQDAPPMWALWREPRG